MENASRVRLAVAATVAVLASLTVASGAVLASAPAQGATNKAVVTQAAPRAAVPAVPHLVVYGDSLSAGVNQERPGPAWPLLVAGALGDGEPRAYAMPGFRAGDIDAATQASGVRTGDATVLVIEAGTNDLVMSTPLARFRADYAALVARTLDTAIGTPRLLCLGVWHRDIDANNLGATGGDYDAIIQATCAANGGTYLPLASLYSTPGDISPRDSFHPSTAGQAAIVALVAPYARAPRRR